MRAIKYFFKLLAMIIFVMHYASTVTLYFFWVGFKFCIYKIPGLTIHLELLRLK